MVPGCLEFAIQFYPEGTKHQSHFHITATHHMAARPPEEHGGRTRPCAGPKVDQTIAGRVNQAFLDQGSVGAGGGTFATEPFGHVGGAGWAIGANPDPACAKHQVTIQVNTFGYLQIVPDNFRYFGKVSIGCSISRAAFRVRVRAANESPFRGRILGCTGSYLPFRGHFAGQKTGLSASKWP